MHIYLIWQAYNLKALKPPIDAILNVNTVSSLYWSHKQIKYVQDTASNPSLHPSSPLYNHASGCVCKGFLWATNPYSYFLLHSHLPEIENQTRFPRSSHRCTHRRWRFISPFVHGAVAQKQKRWNSNSCFSTWGPHHFYAELRQKKSVACWKTLLPEGPEGPSLLEASLRTQPAGTAEHCLQPSLQASRATAGLGRVEQGTINCFTVEQKSLSKCSLTNKLFLIHKINTHLVSVTVLVKRWDCLKKLLCLWKLKPHCRHQLCGRAELRLQHLLPLPFLSRHSPDPGNRFQLWAQRFGNLQG